MRASNLSNISYEKEFLNLQCDFSVIGGLGSVCLLHTSPTMEKHRNVRKGLRVPKMTPRHIEILKNMHNRRPYWHKPMIVPTSPLSRTAHPKNQFEVEDRKIQEEVLAKSTPDEPIDITEFSKLANQATKDQVKGQHFDLHFFIFESCVNSFVSNAGDTHYSRTQKSQIS